MIISRFMVKSGQEGFKLCEKCYFKRVQFNENDIVKFNFIQDTLRVNIEASLINSDGQEIDVIKDKKEFQIETNDSYKIQVNGSGHRGSFKLEWQVLE